MRRVHVMRDGAIVTTRWPCSARRAARIQRRFLKSLRRSVVAGSDSQETK